MKSEEGWPSAAMSASWCSRQRCRLRRRFMSQTRHERYSRRESRSLCGRLAGRRAACEARGRWRAMHVPPGTGRVGRRIAS
jgi:hypothetical protein